MWGSDEVNVEGWKPMKRLPGHESGKSDSTWVFQNQKLSSPMNTLDVTDLAWSPGDRYLASVGLDSKVIIWCGYTLGPSPLSPLFVVLPPLKHPYRASSKIGPTSRVRKGRLLGPCWRIFGYRFG